MEARSTRLGVFVLPGAQVAATVSSSSQEEDSMTRRATRSRTHKPRDLYAEVTDRIVAALEAGTAPWVCPWRRDGEGGRQRNGASGHVYRGALVNHLPS